MKLERKLIWLTFASLALLITGCGGFRGSYSVSPASFFLPGLLKTEPVQPPTDSILPAPTEQFKSVEVLAKAQ